MKKKFLTLFLAFICALCFVFGFTACGESVDNTDPETDSPAENTEEKNWQTALTDFRQKKNYTLKLTAKSDKTLVKTIKLDGLTYYEKVGNQEHFLSNEGTAFYDYTYTNGKGWVKTVCLGGEYYAYVNSNIDIVGWAALAFSNSYTSFKRSGGKYTAEFVQVDDNTDLEDIAVTLNGNSVTEVEFVRVDSQEVVTITDIGTSQIQLPLDYVDETSIAKVSAKEWETALDISSYVNFTAEAWYGNEQFVLKADLGKEVYYLRDNSSAENYYSIENETCYNYKKESKDELYTRTEKDKEYFSEQFAVSKPMFVLAFKKSYSKFTYDNRSDTYRADNVTVNGVTYSADFKFENGKLIEAFINYGEYFITFFDYGTTIVTLPEVFSEGSDI